MVLSVAGCGAPTNARRIRDGLLRDAATESHAQSAVQSAAMGAVLSTRRPILWPAGLWPAVGRALHARDRLRTGTSRLRPAIWPIRRSAFHRPLRTQCGMGRAAAMG